MVPEQAPIAGTSVARPTSAASGSAVNSCLHALYTCVYACHTHREAAVIILHHMLY